MQKVLNINYIDYSPATKSLDIFVAGCLKPICKDCCNPELIDFNNGTEWHLWINTIKEYIYNFNTMIDNIFLLGGSFNHQEENPIKEILIYLSAFNKNIWLFARENLDNIKPTFKQYCQFIKCGEYIPNLKCDNNIQEGVKLATSNQIIYKKGIDY